MLTTKTLHGCVGSVKWFKVVYVVVVVVGYSEGEMSKVVVESKMECHDPRERHRSSIQKICSLAGAQTRAWALLCFIFGHTSQRKSGAILLQELQCIKGIFVGGIASRIIRYIFPIKTSLYNILSKHTMVTSNLGSVTTDGTRQS